MLSEFPLAYREGLLDAYLFNEFVAQEAIDILGAGIAAEKGLSPGVFIAAQREAKLKRHTAGRLDRWNVPKPLVRVIRGLLYAAGKEY